MPVELPVHTFQIAPFDMAIQDDVSVVQSMQLRFANWLRGLTGPARLCCWQRPADLADKIGQVSKAARTASERRQQLLMAYRRSYERLQESANYQRTLYSMALWSNENPAALAGTLSATFETAVIPAPFPPLLTGRYELCERPLWHLNPVGRPGGRAVWAVLSSYEFMPATWNFFEPLVDVLRLNLPLALCVDIPRTYDRHTATDKIESIILAYQTHLATASGEDSRSVRRIHDCRRTLQELNDGDALHEMQLIVAVPAYDLPTLKEWVQAVANHLRPWVRMRPEIGELLSRSVRFFAPIKTRTIGLPDGTWPVTSSEAALAFGPLGYPKLSHTDGVMRGEAVEGAYPVFYQSWRATKHASHEVWVGMTGFGKSFALNSYLTREYAELGTPFDLLEPMGHGKLIADAFDVPLYALSQATRLNPQDVMFPTLLEQTSHTIRIYETVLGRRLSGTQPSNLERGLLAKALELAYGRYPSLEGITPDQSPTCDTICDIIAGLGEQPRIQTLARNLADELAALCIGSGPWSRFLNGQTTVDFGRRQGQLGPRVFSFHELESDPVMVALAYTQVLSAIRRDSLLDEQPRIIAVDEVYRLMRHPALLDFLIEAAKTFRTKRKKAIMVDQNLSVFLEGKARLIFENCPIRVIFNQRQGLHVFADDPAFGHLNSQHRRLIGSLPRYHFLFDVQNEGTWLLFNRAMDLEKELYGSS
ncbi:MAG: hypothetical protein L0154_26490 [Chloroflexi bacterium]|nr:hypothetical protein [Chloroflexota bacterium]